MSRSRKENDPPEPEIETIRNRWGRAWQSSHYLGVASQLLAVLAVLIAGWAQGSLVARLASAAILLLVTVWILAFYLGRKVGYQHGIEVKKEDEITKQESPYDRERDEIDDQ